MDDKARKDIMEKAKAMLDAGWHCSESVLIAVGENYFKISPEMKQLSTPFAGGVGNTHHELCGALTGGLMVIGGAMGRSNNGTEDQACQDTAAAWREAFLTHFGQLRCCELRENWIGQPGQPDCSELVRQAAGVLMDLLAEAGVDPSSYHGVK